MNRLLATTFALILTACGLTASSPTASDPTVGGLTARTLGQDARPPGKKGIAADPDPASVQDVVLLTDDRPVLLRLIVTIDGQPLGTAWDNAVDRIFSHYDKDSNGKLNRDEAKAILPVTALGNGLNLARVPVALPKFADLDTNRDGSISPAELRDYYRNAGLPPVSIRTSQQSVGPLLRQPNATSRDPVAITAALWRTLDTDKDGKLSVQELAQAERSLLALDADDDEILSLNEVAPTTNPPNMINPLGMGVGNAPPLELVQKGQPARNLAWRILSKYGPPDRPKLQPGLPALGQLNPDELGWDPEIVQSLDFNRNGKLEAFELARFAELPPDAVVSLTLSSKGAAKVKLLAGGQRADTKLDENEGCLFVGRTRIEFTSTVPTKQGFPMARPALAKARVMAIFTTLDTDMNGYLDRNELMNSPFAQNFALIDTDSNGMVYERELVAFVERTQSLQALAEQAGMTISVANQGKSLFDLLDLNADGRLSVWEMRQAPRLLTQILGKAERPLERSDLSQTVRFNVQRGATLANDNGIFILAARQQPTSTEPPEPTAGPMWFRKMDRNRDGFVSRREFLSSSEDFDRLDRDGDGLISPAEADQAPRRRADD